MPNMKQSQQLRITYPSILSAASYNICAHQLMMRSNALKRGLAATPRKQRPLPLCRRNTTLAATTTCPATTTKLVVRRKTRPLPLCRRKGSSGSKHETVCVTVLSVPIKSGDEVDDDDVGVLEKKTSLVHFHNNVSVVPIKSRRDYPKITLKRMYSSRKEIKANVKRNRLEFLADGKDWRNVLEEDDMVMDDSGEFVHPVHYIGLPAFRKQVKLSCTNALRCC